MAEINDEFFHEVETAEEIARKMAESDRLVDPGIPIPGVNSQELRSGEDAIEEYCKKNGITREEFDEIPASERNI